ncbi:MAG: asparagine synthase-related protein [Bacteroidales bacterium]|nr:asparagine synthase-related protein [Bacteroidales bacterium]
MSAVFGIVNKDNKPVVQDSIDTMLSVMGHRATDGNNTWMEKNVGFGHCLLKTYPQQEYEHCPHSILRCTITADARLDNREELAALLGINRIALNEISDPEIIVLAYKRWDENCVDYLDGEFAFVIWDASKHKLYAAVDRIGFRPLFYYDSLDMFIFSSEIKGIVAIKPKPDYFNEESLIEYFYRSGTPDNTYNRDVFALCGGSVLTMQNSRVSCRKYWNLKTTGKYSFKKDEDWYECAHELLFRAVEKRLNPNIPTGITLSGGLDSTSIACILSEKLMRKNKPLYAFSSVLPIDYQGGEQDERKYIEIVGKHCPNIIQTYVDAPEVGPYTNLEEALEIEESFPNAFFYMDKALLEAANKMNVKSLFSGFGGDFWISWKGDTVIYELIKKGELVEALALMNKLRKEDSTSFYRIVWSTYLSKSKAYHLIRDKIFVNQNRLAENNLLKIMQQKNVVSYNYYCLQIQDKINSGKIGRILGMLANRNGFYLSDSMIPLIDVDLLTFLSDMPLSLHLKNGRRRNVLREAIKNIIPTQIFNRKDKMPFSPDYKIRILREKKFYENTIESIKNNQLSSQYMNATNAIELLNLALHNNIRLESKNTVYNKVAHIVIAQHLMTALKKSGYSL